MNVYSHEVKLLKTSHHFSMIVGTCLYLWGIGQKGFCASLIFQTIFRQNVDPAGGSIHPVYFSHLKIVPSQG